MVRTWIVLKVIFGKLIKVANKARNSSNTEKSIVMK